MSTLVAQHTAKAFEIVHKAQALMLVVQTWMDRHHQRRQLAQLAPELLNDLGLDADQAQKEAAKPFWK